MGVGGGGGGNEEGGWIKGGRERGREEGLSGSGCSKCWRVKEGEGTA